MGSFLGFITEKLQLGARPASEIFIYIFIFCSTFLSVSIVVQYRQKKYRCSTQNDISIIETSLKSMYEDKILYIIPS
jgi:hypothetical protein